MFDVIVVGARCAGAPLAMLLATRGAKVLLVDRSTFPSDIPHGHYIHRHGPRRLREWGLLDRVAAYAPAVSNMLIDVGDFPLRVGNLIEDGLAWGYGPRRSTLDQILIDAAVESGVEFRAGVSVSEYLFDGDRLVGIRGRQGGSRDIEERATITVGADGRNSMLARAVDAPMYQHVPTILCYYFSYWSDVDTEQFELYVRTNDRRVIFSFRTESDLFAVFMGAPIEEFGDIRRDIERAFMRTLDLAPDFAARVRTGKRQERFYGASDLPNFYRKPCGPGWALVGDAGLHKDPFMALGICDAFRDVALLADAISDGLSSRRPMAEALADFEAKRNAASTADFDQNIAEARFAPVPATALALRQAVRDRPDDATQMIKARNLMIDRSAFFNPQNLQRLLGSELRG
jgi:2-polyprenyl-6-methoxyphenol hydroxylase-like FAD-dependent oxidoreductase